MSIVRFCCPLYNEFASSARVSEVLVIPTAKRWRHPPQCCQETDVNLNFFM